MENDFLAKHDSAREQARVNALKSVNKMDLPKAIEISDDSFVGLGVKTTRTACESLKRLREKHGDNLPYLVGLSVREAWFALFDGAGYIASMMAEGAVGDNDHTQRMATAGGYGESEGIAWALYNHQSELIESQQQQMFRDGTPFAERLSLEDVLNGAAMYWFAAAAIAYHANNIQGAFDWLSEAQDALSLANGNHMWDEGAKLERESAVANSVEVASAAARTLLAKAAAQARHSENRAMKQDVFGWLDANMKSFRSMDAAAEAIAGKLAPVKFRTASDWVREWKKLRSAGTP